MFKGSEVALPLGEALSTRQGRPVPLTPDLDTDL